MVLREAWPAPVLHYTAEYIQWQLRFPGAAARCILARAGGEPAGFIGLSPRRFRFRDAVFSGYVYSYLGVRPAFRGRGLAVKLYEEMMAVMREAALPSVAFIEAHSPAAQHLLFKTCERLDFKMKKLGQYVNHGFVPRASAAPLSAVAAPAHVEEALAAIEACGGERVLWSAPDRALLHHYLRDPRPRQLLVVREGDRPVGAAMAFLSEIATARGFDKVATVDAIFLPQPTADQIAAVLRATADIFAGAATTPVVSAPNLATADPEVLKAARLRATGNVFDGYVLHGERHPLLEAEVTNLEVV